jgi:tetrahydromethanopterin S-methyltransferase subunit G
MVPQEDYAELQERLHVAEDRLEEVFAERLEA